MNSQTKFSKIFISDFDYFGLQNGNQCHCGDNASRFIPTNSSSCNKPCKGDRSQFCGGSWRLNVYRTQPIYPLVHINGSILTNPSSQVIGLQWNPDYQNFKDELKTDIELLLESLPLVVDASVLVTNISATVTEMKEDETLNRRKRSAEKLLIEFKAVCSVRAARNFEIGEIQFAISSSFQDVNPKLFNYFDEQSLSSISLHFQKTIVIKIEAMSEEKLTEHQGMLY